MLDVFKKSQLPQNEVAALFNQADFVTVIQKELAKQACGRQVLIEPPCLSVINEETKTLNNYPKYRFPEPAIIQQMQKTMEASVSEFDTMANMVSKYLRNVNMNFAPSQIKTVLTSFDIIEKQISDSSKSVVSNFNSVLLHSNITSALTEVRDYLPHAFDFEDIYSGGYRRTYSTIPKNAHIEIRKRGNDEIGSDIIVCTAENDCYPLALQKDIYGCRTLFSDIEERDVVRLISFLANHFALAVTDPIAKKIRTELINYARNYTIKIPCGKRLYRAREWEEGQSVEFLYNEILDPPYGCSGANRFSYPGQNFLYMAEDPKTANKELKTDQITTTMKCILNKELMVLDMADNDNIIFEYCQKRVSGKAVIPREYFLSMYIAEICMSIGIDGIRYKSSVTDGIDYVFFKIHSDSFKDEPETLIDEYLKYREVSSE